MKITKQAQRSIDAFQQMFPDLIVVPSYHAVPPGYAGFTIAARRGRVSYRRPEAEDQPQDHTPGKDVRT